MRCDAGTCTGEIVSLARELSPDDVDLIVAGHPHAIATTEVNGIPLIQAGANGAALGIADLYRTDGGYWRAELNVRRVYADQVTPDASMLEMLTRYQRATDSLANRMIATFQDAPVSREGENELGKIIADGIRAAAQADVALVGNGGIRSVLPAGPVTYGMLYAVMPFDNQLTRLTIEGRDLRRLLEQALGRVQVSGVRITYEAGGTAGSRIVDVRFADGRSLSDDRTYTLAVADYFAEGGDGYTMLRDLSREDLDVKDLDAVIDYLRGAPQPFAIPRDRRVVRLN